jgi:hypothetical protein
VVYLLVFHAYINEMHGSRSKIAGKKFSSDSVARRDLISALKGLMDLNVCPVSPSEPLQSQSPTSDQQALSCFTNGDDRNNTFQGSSPAGTFMSVLCSYNPPAVKATSSLELSPRASSDRYVTYFPSAETLA